MKKIINSKKIITVLTFVCAVLVFCFYVSGNDSLFASNSNNRIQGQKGMSIEEFNKKVSNKNKIVLVYFYADWCVPCIKLKPEILALENETKEFCEILKIDVDENPIVAEHFEINTLPMFVIYKNGNKTWENIGFLTKLQIKSKLEMYK